MGSRPPLSCVVTTPTELWGHVGCGSFSQLRSSSSALKGRAKERESERERGKEGGREGGREGGGDWNQGALAVKDAEARRYVNLNPNLNPNT